MEENEIQEEVQEQVPETPTETSVKTPKKSRKPLILTILIAVVVLVLVLLISSSKPMKIHRFAKFTEDVKMEYTNYSESDLKKAEAKYGKHIYKLNKAELSGKQEEKVRQLDSECRDYLKQAGVRIYNQKYE